MRAGPTLRGVVVGRSDYGEADRIVVFLTEEGRLSAFAPAARRSRRRFGGATEPFTSVHIELGRPRREGLQTLSSLEIVLSRWALAQDLERFALAAYACELSARLAVEGVPTGLLPRLEAVLDALLRDPPSRAQRRSFELGVLCELGYQPELRRCVRCGAPEPARRAPEGVEDRPAGVPSPGARNPSVGTYLDLVQGGLLCVQHRGGAREIGPKTRAWLEAAVQSGGGDVLGPLEAPEAERAARAVGPSIDAALGQLLIRPLSSLGLLTELGY